ncbi:MAG: hypothetical protein ACFCD0_15845 [Gemmataceae bacterium]
MNLLRGYQLTVAPRFQLSVAWEDRIVLSPGNEEVNGWFYPREPWRTPSEKELCLLVGDDSLESSVPELEDCIGLYQLPQHLVSLWWEMVSGTQANPVGGFDGFDAYACEVCDFLDFKDISVPREAKLDLLASQPGEKSIRWDENVTGRQGLISNSAPETPWRSKSESIAPRLWGGINLGVEPVVLSFLNLPPKVMAQRLADVDTTTPIPTTIGKLGQRFLRACSNYPVVGLKIEPGEGFRFPVDGVLVDGWLGANTDPTLLLLIREKAVCELASTPQEVS